MNLLERIGYLYGQKAHHEIPRFLCRSLETSLNLAYLLRRKKTVYLSQPPKFTYIEM